MSASNKFAEQPFTIAAARADVPAPDWRAPLPSGGLRAGLSPALRARRTTALALALTPPLPRLTGRPTPRAPQTPEPVARVHV